MFIMVLWMEILEHFSCFVLSTAWIIGTLTVGVCALHSNISCNLPSEKTSGNIGQPGDVMLGATFPLHLDRVIKNLHFTSKPSELQCQLFSTEHFQSMHALIFAVEEINTNDELLPNITLGFHIFDTCITLRQAALSVLRIMSGGQEITPNFQCGKRGPLFGFIGDSGSTQSILMAQILGLYRYTQISYLATNPILSDRYLFPSFYRTIPSDEFQIQGLAQLIMYFGWSWFGLLASDDDYGQFGTQMIKQEILKAGACVAFVENILTGQPDRNSPHLANIIRKSTVKVIVVIATDHNFFIVVEELSRQNLTGYTWVATEGWATAVVLSEERFQLILKGAIGFAINGRRIPEFTNYLHSLHPYKEPRNSFIREFWEATFTCKWLNEGVNIQQTGNETVQICTGNETLESVFPEKDYRVALKVYTAVYAVSWALHQLLHCSPRIGLLHTGDCTKISSFRPWHLQHYIENVHFKTKDGSQVFFDAKGNPPAVYDIVNWRASAKGKLEQVTVGNYDLNAVDGKTLKVDGTAIIWYNHKTQVPISKCSPSCLPGYRKVTLEGKPLCCYNCAQCPQGQISNQTDAVKCHPCPSDTWPNVQQDRCLPRITEFLSYEEPLGYSLAAIACFSSLVPLFILGVFIYYKRTAIVRANNYIISCSLLLSLYLCFLCSLGFIGYPQQEKCLLRQVAFGIVFSLCISCVLAKTILVLIAFNATKPGSRLRTWTMVNISYFVIIFCVLTQVFLCVIWLIFSPPFPEMDTSTKPGIIIVMCNEGSPTAFWCMLGYLGFLAATSFIVAFMARRLPDSFNEAKLITFSMLAFLSVWVSFIPAYLSAQGMYCVAMEVFAIQSSSWAVVICIFVPKCFMVLYKSNMNFREQLVNKSKCKR